MLVGSSKVASLAVFVVESIKVVLVVDAKMAADVVGFVDSSKVVVVESMVAVDWESILEVVLEEK